MSFSDNEIDIILRLQGLNTYVASVDTAAEKTRQLGAASEEASSASMGAAGASAGAVGMIGSAARDSAVGVSEAGAASMGVLTRIGTVISGTAMAVGIEGAKMAEPFVALDDAAETAQLKVMYAMDKIRATMAKALPTVVMRTSTVSEQGAVTPVKSSAGKEESAAESTASGGLLAGLGSSPAMLAIGGLVAGVTVKDIIEKAKAMSDSVTQMLVAANSLHTVTGMTNQDALAWNIAAGAYGVSTSKVAMSFKLLATQASAALGNNLQKPAKASVELFDKLGISASQLRANSGNMNNMFWMTIDALNKMPPGLNKTTVASKLLGRNWTALLPMLTEGSNSIKQVTDMMKEMGVKGGNGAMEQAAALHSAEIKMKEFGQVAKIAIAQQLIPALIKVLPVLTQLGTELAKGLVWSFQEVGKAIVAVNGYIRTHQSLMHTLGQIVTVTAGIIKNIVVVGFKIMSTIISTQIKVITWLVNAWIAAGKWIAGAWNTISSTVSKVWNTVLNPIFSWIGNAAKTLWGFIQNMASIFSSAWNTVNNATSGAWKIIGPILAGFSGPISAVGVAIGGLGTVWDGIWSTMQSAAQIAGQVITIALSGISTIISGISSAINGLKSAVSWLAGVGNTIGGAFTSSLPSSQNPLAQGPYTAPGYGNPSAYGGLAAGGIVTHPTLSWIGEAGPELVIPLTRKSDVVSALTPQATIVHQTEVQATQLNKALDLKIEVPVIIDRKEIARAVGRVVDDAMARA